jgi:hypothetical protein
MWTWRGGDFSLGSWPKSSHCNWLLHATVLWLPAVCVI